MQHRAFTARRLAAVLLALLTSLCAWGVFASSSTAGPAGKPLRAQVAKTTITLDVTGCDGCTVTLVQSLPNGHVGFERKRTITEGRAIISVPTRKTRGVLTILDVPGFDSLVFTGMRYPGKRVGSTVSFRSLAGKERGYACWGGTTERQATIPITVRRVTPDGEPPYVVAWASTTQPWTAPAFFASDGFITALDLTPCDS